MCILAFLNRVGRVHSRRDLAYQIAWIYASKKPLVARGRLLPLCARIIAFLFNGAFLWGQPVDNFLK